MVGPKQVGYALRHVGQVPLQRTAAGGFQVEVQNAALVHESVPVMRLRVQDNIFRWFVYRCAVDRLCEHPSTGSWPRGGGCLVIEESANLGESVSEGGQRSKCIGKRAVQIT